MALVPEQDELFPCPQSDDGAKVVIVNDRCHLRSSEGRRLAVVCGTVITKYVTPR
jgi:hypothetical protein